MKCRDKGTRRVKQEEMLKVHDVLGGLQVGSVPAFWKKRKWCNK